MNFELFSIIAVLSIAYIIVGFLSPSVLFPIFHVDSITATIPTTKSSVDTKSFLETVEATTTTIDTTPPVVSVPEDIIAEATGPEGRIVNYEANATDNVDGNLATVCNPNSGSMFALGQTRVECSANDAAGNNGKNEFVITVRDTTPPETMLGNVTVGWLGSITSGDTTPSVDINFDFNGTDLVGISHYECRLDNGSWKSAHTLSDISGEEINICTYTGVRDPGSHDFQVRAVDTSENKDPSPSSFMWNIESPVEATQGLITQVNNIYPTLQLDPPLHQVVEDLSDTSTSNDANSCYMFSSFMNEIKVQNMIGSLSLTDLNGFAITTLAITNNIGCPPPIANAGSPQSVEAGEKGVMLDGSDSFYAGNTPSVKWKQTDGSPKVEIKNSGKAKATFDAPTFDQFKDVGNSTTLTFELTAVGAGDLKSTATTTVTVNAVNIPPVTESAVNSPPIAKSQRVTTDIDTSATITLDATDKDGDSLTYSIGTTPNHGSLSSFDKDTGSVVYNPNSGYSGSDSFTFNTSDESSTSNTAEVSINVNPVTHINSPPVAESQDVTINMDTSAPITLDATDNDGDSLTYSIGTTPNHGSLSPFDEHTGEVVYNPNGGYTGSDSFTFTVSDESSTSNTAEVSITVNPVANINATSAPENANGKGNDSQSALPNTTSLPSDQNTSNITISLPSNETD
ncbi:MAG TPA: tandem-95 repeat protein [Nitrososphaeraceae archaeon]|nr:tandem-95 repeat protein [Nitrososphaeraceae archaeon]